MSKKHAVKLRFTGLGYPSGVEKFRYEVTGLPKDFDIEKELGLFVWRDQVSIYSLDKLEVPNKDQVDKFDGEIQLSRPRDNGTQWWNPYVNISKEMLLAQLERTDSTKAKASVQTIVQRRANRLADI